MKQTQVEINQYAGGNAPNIRIMVTETDSSYELDSVPAALFAADTYLTFLDNGVENVDWWDLHNGAASTGTKLADGSTDYGDQGILASGGCAGSTCEPAVNTPFPAYYGLQAVAGFAPTGAQLVAATSSNAMVTAYAVKTSSGTNVMLLNHDSRNSESVSVGYAGFNPASVVSAEQFSDANRKLSPLSGVNARSLTLPAYSITVLKLSGPGSRSGSAHGASCTVSTSTTASWPGGYTQSVRITNTGSAAVSGWKVTFAFPSSERVTASWNVTHSQSGETVLAQPVSYDKTIAAGGSLPFGFNASYSGTTAPPTWYDLNGVRCRSAA